LRCILKIFWPNTTLNDELQRKTGLDPWDNYNWYKNRKGQVALKCLSIMDTVKNWCIKKMQISMIPNSRMHIINVSTISVPFEDSQRYGAKEVNCKTYLASTKKKKTQSKNKVQVYLNF
jgi:hypothetical protein